jgi:hypothetical protein
MDRFPESTDSQIVCVCGRAFMKPGALSYHLRSCTQSKKRLSGALSVAREIWARKRRRVTSPEPRDGSLPSAVDGDLTPAPSNHHDSVGDLPSTSPNTEVCHVLPHPCFTVVTWYLFSPDRFQ